MAQQKITQQLGFRVGGALRSLGALNKKLERSNDLFRQMGRATTGSTAPVQSLANTSKQLKKTQRRAAGFTVTWETMLRVIQTQIIVRSFAQLTRNLSEGTERARELGLAIAEIKSIAGGDLGLETGTLQQDVLALSESLGETATVVAEGVYQTLSNQISDAADATAIFEKAARLAAVTNSKSSEVVNALSSVMNSYGLTVADTERVMDGLFATIELGRIRMSELGNSLGRVLPLASQMGVSFEEVGGALAVMTRQGVKTNTATTQLRAVLQKLLRPSDALKAIFEDWGVDSGPAAIQAFGGLQGVLQKLQQETNFNATAQGDLFQRVRAVTSALALGVDNGEAYKEAIEAITNSTGRATEEIERYRDTAAFELTQAQITLENSWTKLGTELIPLTTGAIKILTDNVRFLGIATRFVTGGYTEAYNAQQDINRIQKEINKEVQEFKENAEIEGLDDYDELLTSAAQYYRIINKEETKLRDTRERNITFATKALRNAQNRIADAYESSAENLEGFIKRAGNIWKTTLDEIAGIQQDIDDRLLENRLSNAETAGERLRIIESEIADQRERAAQALQNVDANEESKEAAQQEFERLDALAQQGEQLAEQIGQTAKVRRFQEEGVNALLRQQEAASRYANAVENAVPEVRKELQIRREGEEEINKLFKARLELAKQISTTQDSDALRDLSGDLQDLDKEIKDVFERSLEGVEFLRSIGIDEEFTSVSSKFEEALNQATFDWAREVDRAQAEFSKRIIPIKAAIDPVGAGAELARVADIDQGFDETEAEFQNRLAKEANQIVTARESALDSIQAQQKRILGLSKEISRASHGIEESLESRNERARKAAERYASQHDVLGTARRLVKEQRKEHQEQSRVLDQLLSKYDSVQERIQAGETITREETEAIKQQTQEAGKLLNLNQEEKNLLKGLQVALATMQKRYQEINAIDASKPTRDAAEAAENYLEQLRFIRQRVKEIGSGADAARIAINDGAQNFLNMNTYAREAAERTRQASDNTGDMVSSLRKANVSIPSLIGSTVGLAGAFETAANQAKRMADAVNSASFPGSAAGLYHGGSANRFFADGGMARGQDRTLASLSEGEYVVNSKNSRRFFSQLNAMNQGSEPVYRDQGGSVTNVGDVNVTVQGGDTSQQTVREIGHALRREVQRGNIKLR